MSQKIHVLTAMDSATKWLTECGFTTPLSIGTQLGVAREAMAEFIEAVKENRRLTEVFAQDGCPENYFAYDESERRVLRALERIGATP